MTKILINALNGTSSTAARQAVGDSREGEWFTGPASVCLSLSRFELAEWWLKRNTIGPRVRLCALHSSITSRAFPSAELLRAINAVQGAVQCKGCLEALTTEVTRHFLYLTHVMETTVGDQSSVKSRWNFLIKFINPPKRSPHNTSDWAAGPQQSIFSAKIFFCFSAKNMVNFKLAVQIRKHKEAWAEAQAKHSALPWTDWDSWETGNRILPYSQTKT